MRAFSDKTIEIRKEVIAGTHFERGVISSGNRREGRVKLGNLRLSGQMEKLSEDDEDSFSSVESENEKTPNGSPGLSSDEETVQLEKKPIKQTELTMKREERLRNLRRASVVVPPTSSTTSSLPSPTSPEVEHKRARGWTNRLSKVFDIISHDSSKEFVEQLRNPKDVSTDMLQTLKDKLERANSPKRLIRFLEEEGITHLMPMLSPE